MPCAPNHECEYDVVICGAGPTGLVTALSVIDPDIKILVLTKHTERSLNARAINLWHRNVESLYLYDRTLYDKFANEVTYMTHWAFAFSNIIYIQLPLKGIFPSKLAPLPWVLPQMRTEQLLEDFLRSHHSRLEYRAGWRVDSVSYRKDAADQDVPTLRLNITDVTTQQSHGVRARFVIGADGSKSAVRKAIGMPFDSLSETYGCWIADGKITYRKRSLGTDEMVGHLQEKLMFISTPQDMVVLLPFKRDLIRMGVIVPPEMVPESSAAPPGIEEFNQKLAAIDSPYLFELYDVVSTSAARFAYGLARVFSDESKRVFLSGDAAHTVTPAGGQGMNLGMQDGFNLGWKLRMCLKYPHIVNADALLQSYELERRPVAKQIMDNTRSTSTFYFLKHLEFVWWLWAHFVWLVYRYTLPRELQVMSQVEMNYSGTAYCVEDWSRRRWYHFWERCGVKAGHHMIFTEVRTSADSHERVYLPSLCDKKGFTVIYFPSLEKCGEASAMSVPLLDTAGADQTWRDFCDKLPSYHFSPLISKIITVDSSESASDVTDVQWAESQLVKFQTVQDVDSRVQYVGVSPQSCVYIIRPDFFVGFRSRPLKVKSLCDWFATFCLSF